MTNLFAFSTLSSEDGPRMDREWTGPDSFRSCRLLFLLFSLLFVGVGSAWGTTTYKLTSVTSVSAGNKYVFVQSSRAMKGTTSSNYVETTDSYNTTGLTGTESYVWTLEAGTEPNTSNSGFYIKNCSTTVYVRNSDSDGTKLTLPSSTGNPAGSTVRMVWSFAFSNGTATISCVANSRVLAYAGASDYRYRAYASNTSNPKAITVYRLDEEASCSANPSIGDASLNGSISLSSFPVQTTGWTVGANCAWSDFGFVWSSSVSTPTLESNGTASSGCTKIQKATDGTATSTNHSITGTFNTSTSYYVRGYGKNGYASGTYQYTDVLTITPRSVEFNSNGGSAVDTKYVNSGTKVTAPSDPTKTGYNFGEWQLNSSEFDFANTNVTSNITLVATWTAKTTTVSFNQTSGTGGQTGTLTATYGSAMPTPITCPTRTGYTFGGYYDGTGGTGTQYYTNTGASARNWDITDATKTLYAKWTVKSFTVTWMVNGSEWTPKTTTGEGTDGSTSVNFGSRISTLPTAPTTSDGCGDKFVGWTTVAEYVHGTSPLFTTAGTAPVISAEGDVTYYAVFADYDE